MQTIFALSTQQNRSPLRTGNLSSFLIRQVWGKAIMQDQRRSMPSTSLPPSPPTNGGVPYINMDNGWSQAHLPYFPGLPTPSSAPNQFHSGGQPSYNPYLNPSTLGSYNTSTPCYATNYLDPGNEMSYDQAFGSQTVGAQNTAALTPFYPSDQQWNTSDTGLARLWDASAMQLPASAAAAPYSTANEHSTFLPTEDLGLQGLDEHGLAFDSTGTSSLPAGYEPYSTGNGPSWSDPAYPLSPVDHTFANNLVHTPTWPASSTLVETDL